MKYLVESYCLLLRIEVLLRFRDLNAIHQLVRSYKSQAEHQSSRPTVHDLCKAIDYACVFYPRQVFCLQRSAATTLLLRTYQYQAEMVLGAQTVPFKAHAWVEIEGVVVNDKPYMLEMFHPLERC